MLVSVVWGSSTAVGQTAKVARSVRGAMVKDRHWAIATDQLAVIKSNQSSGKPVSQMTGLRLNRIGCVYTLRRDAKGIPLCRI